MVKKITRKEVMATHQHVLKVGYCDLQCLLNYSKPYACTVGVYGWNSDIYLFGNVAISTGYRPCGDIQCSHELCQKYEDFSQTEYIRYNSKHGTNYEDLEEYFNDLLFSFIDEAIATNGKGRENVQQKRTLSI